MWPALRESSLCAQSRAGCLLLLLPQTVFSLVLLESSPFFCPPWFLLPTPESALMGQVGVRMGCTAGSSSGLTCCLTLAVPSPVGVATPALILTWLL